MIHVPLSYEPSDLKEAEGLASLRFSKDDGFDQYADSGQTDSHRKQFQQVLGTLGEFAVYRFFFNLDIECSRPDTEWHPGRSKSHGADLILRRESFLGVKSCEQPPATELSWIFQFQPRKDPIFFRRRPNWWYAFVSVEVPLNGKAYLHGILSGDTLQSKDLFQLPKIQRLEASKRAVYERDLKPLTLEERFDPKPYDARFSDVDFIKTLKT